MAEVIKTFDWNSSRRTKYPWEEWTSGKTFFATKEKDYLCKDISFAAALRGRASQKGLRVRLRTNKEGTTFQFSDKDGNFE